MSCEPSFPHSEFCHSASSSFAVLESKNIYISTLVGFHNCHNSMTDGRWRKMFFFLLQTKIVTPIRHSRVNTDLFHRMSCWKMEACVCEVSVEMKVLLPPRLKAVVVVKSDDQFLLNAVWLHCSVVHHMNLRTISVPNQDPKSNDLIETSSSNS